MRNYLSWVGGILMSCSLFTGPIYDMAFGFPFGYAFVTLIILLVSGMAVIVVGGILPDRTMDLPILHREKKLKRLKASLEEEAKRYHEDTEEEHLLEEMQAEIKAIEATLSGNERVRGKRRSYDLVRKSKKMIG